LAPLVQQEIEGRFPVLTRGVTVQSASLGELVTDMGAFALAIPQTWIVHWRHHRPWEALPTVHLNDPP